MSHVPGYDPRAAAAVGAGVVSYPSTYQGVKTGTYGTAVGTAVSVPQGNVTYRAQPGAKLVLGFGYLYFCRILYLSKDALS